MEKKSYLHLLIMIIIAMMSVGLISCSKDDDNAKDDYEKTGNLSDQDPEGTIVLNMASGANNNYYRIGDLGLIHIDAANNFRGYDGNNSFVSVGLIDGLSKITQIPKSGWAESAAVVPGTGYLMRYRYNSSYLYQYARIYVVEYLGSTYTDGAGNTYGEITGAKIKYQVSFQLPIKLNNTSLSFDSGADSKTIELENPTTFTIKEKPNWCEVYSKTESIITINVTENLTAEQRQGDIVLGNTSNSVKISITQKGALSPIFQAGCGTAEDPYQIKTAQQLKSITKALNAHFILTADITLNEEANGSGWDPVGKQESPFSGTIDGQGHTIKNLWMKRPTTNGVGLFGYVQYATITGICLEIGNNGLNGGNYVGGICGYSIGGVIQKCSVSGVLNGNDGVGGICGDAQNATISQCYTEGTLISERSAFGITNSASISDCFSTMNLTGFQVYGIGGNNITRCYYAGKASPSYGYNNSYGFYCSGTYTYYDSYILGVQTNDAQTYKNARTTSQMKTQSNYEGWDFTNTWKITEGMTYPTLRCFGDYGNNEVGTDNNDGNDNNTDTPVNDKQFVYFTGSTDGWRNPEQRLESPTCNGIYNGFLYIANPSGGDVEFKFQKRKGDWADNSQLNCNNLIGVSGDFEKTSDAFKATTGAGVYYVELNLLNNTLKGTLVRTMGIIGGFNSWADDIAMAWNAEDYCYEAKNVDVDHKEWKFRINNDWTISLGGVLNNLVIDGQNLTAVGNTIKLYPTRKTSNKIYCIVE